MQLGIPGISEATQIGQGGFGVVYRARQEAVGRTVAVKILSVPTLGEEDRRRFERECHALGALSGHPNIVAVFDSGVSAEQRPYLVMDYLSEGTLSERLERSGPLSWQIAADIGVKLAGALGAAHAAGVLHRDVKPDNVLVSAYGEPQLVDFGIARLLGGSQSRVGEITATLAHAAPEVLAGQPATEASDVYSLASTLYELLSGYAPFVRPTDETFHALLERARTEDPPDLRDDGLPDEIWQPLSAALAKDPQVRTPTARALADALQGAQRTLGAEVTPLVLPAVAKTPAAPGAGVGSGANTIFDQRRQREPSAPSQNSAGTSRRRRLLLLAGVACALLLIAGGAAALIATDDDAASSLATAHTEPTTTATLPASPAKKPSGASPTPNSKPSTPAKEVVSPAPIAPGPSGGGGQDTSPSGGGNQPPTPSDRKKQTTKKKKTTTTPKDNPPPPPPPTTPPPPTPPPPSASTQWQVPSTPDGVLHCGSSKSFNTPTGSVTAQQCLSVYRSGPGASPYYQGVLKLTYRSSSPVMPGAAYGNHKSFIDGQVSGSTGCGNVTFAPGEEQWCYTPTVNAGGVGHRMSASGTAGNSASNTSVTLVSPTITS